MEITTKPFPDDDGSLRFAHRAGIYVAENEAAVPRGRRTIRPSRILSRSPLVILCFGQSNAANSGAGRYIPRHPVYCFNFFNGRFYIAEDPLPGASGNGGSPWGRLGDLLIEGGYCGDVLFVSVAVGGSFISHWQQGGEHNRRLRFAVQRLIQAGIRVDLVFWQQGEAEANLTSMSREEYSDRFHQIVGDLRTLGVSAPIYVAQSTLCETAKHPYLNREEIRAAQAQLGAASANGLFPGPDTDIIGPEGRTDGCHFNEAGLQRSAELWLEVVKSWLSVRSRQAVKEKDMKSMNAVVRSLIARTGWSLMKLKTYHALLGEIEGYRRDRAQAQSRVEALENALRAAGLDDAAKQKDPDYQLLMAQQSLMASFDDLDPGFRPIMEQVKPYTMTSVERLYDLFKTVEYIVKARVPGNMLECGVWRGGSMMLVARTLLAMGDTSRTLYLFDTYEGHLKPDAELDVDLWGNRAVNEWVNYRKTDECSSWAYVSLDEVKADFAQTGYPMDKVVFVKGMIEKTAPTSETGPLSLARLDTDWYASAKASLESFWPRLSIGGSLIVDDYGHYVGQRKAVDEYFAASPVLLHRIDYSCRSILKTGCIDGQ